MMKTMKFVLSFCLITTLVSYCAANQAVYGKRIVGDELLYRADVQRPGIKGFSHDVYVSYPKDWQPSQDKQITAIYVENNNENAIAQPVLAYDADKDWSVLKQIGLILRGQLSKGIDATVEFYGKDL
ncbi:hypothetical protein DOY81_013769 [Sarcophaga bullata]|nr:hypothetical protein DOY81_013769 [Sarcophaga bullata]